MSLLLAWPEEQEEAENRRTAVERAQSVEERAGMVSATAATLGVDLESMYERQLRARTLALAKRAENQRQAEAARTESEEV